ILAGHGTTAQNDVVVLNAAAAIMAAELADDWDAAITLAKQSIESGAAAHQLTLATS
ncbi:MAG: anthranilate phosphoribosyltransferase, partial [Chloroflexi bacterium]